MGSSYYPERLCVVVVFAAVLLVSSGSVARAANALVIDEQVFTQVAASVGNSVVSISTDRSPRVRQFVRQHGDASLDQFLRDVLFDDVPLEELNQMGLGSGVIVDSAGYILTNNHIVSGAQKIMVTLTDGRVFNATIMGADRQLDLALIKIKGTEFPAATFADSDTVLAGQWALALGNPLGFMVKQPRPTVAIGVVSAVHRGLPRAIENARVFIDLIQTDAAINPGNSGGPLVNSRGEVIGINVFLPKEVSATAVPGFAIPANDAKRLLTHIVHGGQVLSGWLGIRVQDLNVALADYFGMSKAQGVLVTEVLPDSPAYRAGLKEKDIVTKFNNERIVNASEFFRLMNSSAVGETIALKVYRNNILSTYTVRVGQKPADVMPEVAAPVAPPVNAAVARLSWRGMDLAPAPAGSGGVSVIGVKGESPSHQAGILVTDVITQINARPVAALSDVQQAIAEVKGNALVKTNRGYVIIDE